MCECLGKCALQLRKVTPDLTTTIIGGLVIDVGALLGKPKPTPQQAKDQLQKVTDNLNKPRPIDPKCVPKDPTCNCRCKLLNGTEKWSDEEDTCLLSTVNDWTVYCKAKIKEGTGDGVCGQEGPLIGFLSLPKSELIALLTTGVPSGVVTGASDVAA